MKVTAAMPPLSDLETGASPNAAGAFRVAPVPMADWTEAQVAFLAPRRAAMGPENLYEFLALHGVVLERLERWFEYLETESLLDAQTQRFAIARVGRQRGVADLLERLQGPSAGRDEAQALAQRDANDAALSPAQSAVAATVDELIADAFVGDETWQALTRHFDELQIIELLFVIGDYSFLAMLAKTFAAPRPA